MKNLSILLLSLLCLLTFLEANSRVQMLQDEYHTLREAANNPNIIWIPESFLWQEKFMTRQQLEEKVFEMLFSQRIYSHEQYFRTLLSAVELSKQTRNQVLNTYLPSLEAEILRLGGNLTKSEGSFSDLMDKLSSDEHLRNTSFSNMDCGCPETNPGTKLSYTFPENGSSTGKREFCTYYKEGHIKSYIVEIDGKRHGVCKWWTYSQKFGFYYLSTVEHYLNGDKTKYESFKPNKQGDVFQTKSAEFEDGKSHGWTVVWWDKNKLRKETLLEKGVVKQANYYNSEGVFMRTTYGNN